MAKKYSDKTLKTAIVFGSTGLVGKALLDQLLSRPEYGQVICVNRKPREIGHPRYKEIISDFTNTGQLKDIKFGDDVFCCLGTTIKKAKTSEKFERVDYDLPVEIGKICQEKGVKHFLVVSSIGADARSGNFYLRTKGRMEEAIKSLNIGQKTIVRPSMLLGPRKEFRFGEEIGKVGMKIFKPLLAGKWKKYRAIEAADVAMAMIIIANTSPTKQVVFESDELQEIVDSES
jgi:uncharacterized protein YbjT (DUF2867 family)